MNLSLAMPTWYEVQVDRCDRATRRFRDGGSSSHRTVLERAGTCGAVGHEATVPERTVQGAHVTRPWRLRPVAEDPFHHEHEPAFSLELRHAQRFSLLVDHGVLCGIAGPYRDIGTEI